MEVILAMRSGQDSGEAMVDAAKAYIEAHSADKFSLQAVADALYINASHLLRLFKAHTGETLLGYHNAVRCEKAKALLRHPELSVAQAGEQAGFVTPSHFCHVFKRTVGMTPTEYRGAQHPGHTGKQPQKK